MRTVLIAIAAAVLAALFLWSLARDAGAQGVCAGPCEAFCDELDASYRGGRALAAGAKPGRGRAVLVRVLRCVRRQELAGAASASGEWADCSADGDGDQDAGSGHGGGDRVAGDCGCDGDKEADSAYCHGDRRDDATPKPTFTRVDTPTLEPTWTTTPTEPAPQSRPTARRRALPCQRSLQ